MVPAAPKIPSLLDPNVNANAKWGLRFLSAAYASTSAAAAAAAAAAFSLTGADRDRLRLRFYEKLCHVRR